MKYFVIFLVFVGLIGTAFAQNLGDGPDKLWLPVCPVGTSTECNQSSLFHNAISAPFFQSDSVAIGTIIQKENVGENSISYSINVDFYLKNYQQFDLLTATLNNATEPQTLPDMWYYNSPVFNEGDLVFVYLTKNNGHYELLPESFALDKHEVRGPPSSDGLFVKRIVGTFLQGEKILVSGEVRKMELVKAAKDGEKLDVKLTLHESYDENNVFFSNLMDIDADGSYNYSLDTSNIPPGEYELVVNYGPSSTGTEITINFNSIYWMPLKQFKSGIAIDEIQCRESLILIAKHDGSPVCVTYDTGNELVKRGWITCDDGTSHGRSHPCGPRSSGIVNFDSENYKEVSIIIIPLGAVIDGNEYLIPDEITVVLGKNNTVTWVNEDDTAHGFASDKGGDDSWGTGIISPKKESSIIFNQTGIFEYHGEPHPWMTGKIIVLDE